MTDAAGAAGAGVRGRVASLSPADWLGLAATPAFAGMALLTATRGEELADLLCGGAGAGWLGGMTTMYVLMSVFHAPRWLRLIGPRAR